ncbi:hypothetical protein [Streptomyces sp. M92]|uniref:hypothetical protein n=1 Tax=Streptomyces sp. M92 TaxID=2944250 RepID=UPI00234AF935|nr:hypothetical protein [Streptomyces sp. M92]WCN03932.1 hypothetical protein M6G08_18455 [Streptomyces sp. M92]
MITIEDLFTGAGGDASAAPFVWDPLREPDALQDVGLLDCRMCPLTGRVGLLLDMRTALQYRTGNAALLTVRGLASFEWSEEPLERELLNFAITSSTPSASRKGVRMELALFPDGLLSVAGKAAEFHLLDAEGVPETIPDYTERRLSDVRAGLPWWDSGCIVLRSATAPGT